ncbi:response regulator transcription factor [Patescibacteria group bacterium]
MTDDSKKILLVEDDADLIDMYEAKFKMEGFDVTRAENGAQALNEIKVNKPAAILLDIVMPEIDGFQVLKDLKADPTTKKIPVILLTNLGQDGDIRKGIELGADDYLIKANYTPNEVVDKVNKALAKKN